MHDHSDWSEAEIRQAFNRFDANRSGKLDYRELRHALRALGADVTDRESVRVLQSYDEDGNGLMEIDEFRRLVHKMQRERRSVSSSSARRSDAEIRGVFRQHDANNSSKLDYRELRSALRSLGVSTSSQEAVDILQRHDDSGDGLLDVAEFTRLVRELEGGHAVSSGGGGRGHDRGSWSDGEIRSAFTRYDANNSGRLDYKELRQALRALGANVDNAEAIRVLQSYDEDGNGLMDLDEFRRLVQQMQRTPLAPPSSSHRRQGPRFAVPGSLSRAAAAAVHPMKK